MKTSFPKIPKNLTKTYPGKRVAIVGGKVVAVSENANQSYQEAKTKFPNKKILIYHVPKKNERIHLYRACKFHTTKAIGFSPDLGIDTNLIGQKDFFEKFKICFNSKDKFLEIAKL